MKARRTLAIPSALKTLKIGPGRHPRIPEQLLGVFWVALARLTRAQKLSREHLVARNPR